MVKYISIKQVADDVYDHPLLTKFNYDRLINYAVEFLRVVGMPRQFEEKTEVLKVEDYRALLPCDFDSMIQVRLFNPKDKDVINPTFVAKSDSFHMSPNKMEGTNLTYMLQHNAIYTSIKDGCIEIAYRAIPLDQDGFPLVPDNSAFIRAMEAYIKKRCFTILFDTGKIKQPVLQNAQQEYAFYVGQAQAQMALTSLDEMETLARQVNRVLPYTREHNHGFVTSAAREATKNL